jgi:hypothetical protein
MSRGIATVQLVSSRRAPEMSQTPRAALVAIALVQAYLRLSTLL